MRCAPRAFLRQSRSYLSVSIGISNIWETEWLLLRKCSELRFGCNYWGVKFRASMFIKMVLEVAFGFRNIYIRGGIESCR